LESPARSLRSDKDGAPAQSTSLTTTSITLGGTDRCDFSETSNCGTSRKAGWDCTIAVKFKPTATGCAHATMNIKNAVGTQIVQLSGTAI